MFAFFGQLWLCAPASRLRIDTMCLLSLGMGLKELPLSAPTVLTRKTGKASPAESSNHT